MAVERWWTPVQQAFIANGTANGLITVADVRGFYVKSQVYIKSNTQPPKLLEVKRIEGTQYIYVGETGDITNRTDLSAYLVADGATITLFEQLIPAIKIDSITQGVYAREPIVAIRSALVDEYGRYWGKQNPLPVELQTGNINIGTLNAELEVQLSHKDDFPNAGDVHDSVRIGDGEETLLINEDGSINVNIIKTLDDNVNIINLYDEKAGVPSGAEVTIVSFLNTDPNKLYFLQRCQFSGSQIGHYRLYVDGDRIASARTHHGSGLTNEFVFVGGSQEGLEILPNSLVELRVLHNRPGSGDFEGRLQFFELIKNTIPFFLLLEDGNIILTENNEFLTLE